MKCHSQAIAHVILHWFSKKGQYIAIFINCNRRLRYTFADDHPGWEQTLASGKAYGRVHPLYGNGTTCCVNSEWRRFAFDLVGSPQYRIIRHANR